MITIKMPQSLWDLVVMQGLVSVFTWSASLFFKKKTGISPFLFMIDPMQKKDSL